MMIWWKCLLIFIGGLLFPYLTNLLDMGIQHVQNKQTLEASKIQVEIDEMNKGDEILEPVVGFQTPSNEIEYEFDEE